MSLTLSINFFQIAYYYLYIAKLIFVYLLYI